MLQERLSHLAVNWVDGMSINKSHFVALENHMREQCLDVAGQHLHAYTYGLLPQREALPAQIGMEIDSQEILHVTIKNLRAVTLSGARVEILEPALPQLQQSFRLADIENEDAEERTFALILTVNPWNRQPYGQADPGENPPRKPYVLPAYHLHLMPLSQVGLAEPGQYHLSLGLVHLKNGVFSVDEEYVPPCTSILSHPQLLGFFARTEKAFMLLEQYSIRIMQKVRSKQQLNTLATSINGLAQSILFYLSQQLPAFSLYLKTQPPLHTLEKVISLARLTHNSIQTWQGNGKEELLNYLTEWCDLNQGMLDNTLAELASLSYRHQHAALALQKADNFLKILVPLFRVLSELDYIGKKVDTNLFVTEVMAESTETEKKPMLKGWFKR